MKGVTREFMKEKIMKITTKQKVISIVVIVALVVGTIGGYSIYQNMGKGEAQATLDMASLYQDEIVTVTDIVVGTSETGTASLIYEEIALDSGYEVTETIAVAGVYVNEGDILATLDLENSELDNSDELEELEDAEKALEQLTIETEAKMIEAKSIYDQAVATGTNAETVYDLAVDEIEDGLTEIDEQIASLEEQIEEAEDQVENGLDDDFGLATLVEELMELNEELEEAELAEEEAEAAAEAEAIAEAAAAAETITDTKETQTEQENTISVTETSASTSSSLSDSSMSEVEQIEAEIEAKEAEIEQATEQYEETYNALPDQIEEWEEQIDSLETQRASYVASMDTQEVQAESTYNSSVNTYSNAYASYTLTVSELEEALAEAQELVDELTEALDEEDEEDEAIVIDTEGNLLAPCSGYIMTVTEPSSMTIDGNTIESGLSITVSDGDYAQIDVSISQDDIADIYIGMEANIIFDAYEDILITSEVSSLSLTPSGDMTSSVNYTVTVICDIPQDEGMTIFSSMTATVTFVEAQSNDVLAISTNYIVYEDGQQYVYKEEADGSVSFVEVVTGFSDGFDVEIISGLEEGDIVLNESAVMDIEN